MEGDQKHDYSQIRVPVLAFVGYPKFPNMGYLLHSGSHYILWLTA
jgi:hypothetical protein